MSTGVDWLAAMLLVAYFAHARFNTPSKNRSSTTQAQFQFAQIAYILSAIALFGFLAVLLASSPNIVRALFAGAEPPAYLTGLSSPLLAGLIMTTLLPKVPGLSQIDAGLLKKFQDMGNIPVAVHQLAGKLAARPLQIDSAAMARIVALIQEREACNGLLPADLNMDGSQPTRHKLTRMLHIYLQLQGLKLEAGYGRFLRWHEEELQAAEKAVADILEVADAFCALVRKHEARGSKTEGSPTLQSLRKTFSKQVDAVNLQIAELIARAVFLCERSDIARRRRLQAFGLAERDTAPYPLPPDRVVSVVSMVFVALFVGLAFFGEPSDGTKPSLGRPFIIALMVSIIYGIAVTAAILPKHQFAFAVPGPNGRPIFAYILSGCFGMFGAAIVMMAFRLAMYQEFTAALNDFKQSYPWLGMTFTATVVTAWLCDDYYQQKIVPPWLRWAEGAIAMVVLALAAWLVHDALLSTRLPNGRPVPDLEQVLTIALIVGFAVGSCVPHWYRKARHTAEGVKEAELRPPAGPATAPATP
jgi:hypothetical protein